MTHGVSFVEGNPLKYTDPTGHDVECAGESFEKCHPEKDKQPPPPTPPLLDYHQCQVLCHQGPDPGLTSYVDLCLDWSKVDWLSVSSNGLGLVGDGLTTLSLLDGPNGDEILVGGGATMVNSLTTGINVYGVGVDVYQAAFDGQSPLTAVRDGTLTVTALPKVLTKISDKVPVLGKILPIASFPFHIQGLSNAFNQPGFFQIIPTTGH